MCLHRFRFAALIAAALMLLVIITGCGGGVATLLRIAGVAAFLPDSWTESGGFVRIVADVVADNIIDEVIAEITRADDPDSKSQVILTRNADGKYEGTFQAPENTNETTPVTYSAVITATDTAGNTVVSEPVIVDVPPADESTEQP